MDDSTITSTNQISNQQSLQIHCDLVLKLTQQLSKTLVHPSTLKPNLDDIPDLIDSDGNEIHPQPSTNRFQQQPQQQPQQQQQQQQQPQHHMQDNNNSNINNNKNQESHFNLKVRFVQEQTTKIIKWLQSCLEWIDGEGINAIPQNRIKALFSINGALLAYLETFATKFP